MENATQLMIVRDTKDSMMVYPSFACKNFDNFVDKLAELSQTKNKVVFARFNDINFFVTKNTDVDKMKENYPHLSLDEDVELLNKKQYRFA